jgi:hypothetical protein
MATNELHMTIDVKNLDEVKEIIRDLKLDSEYWYKGDTTDRPKFYKQVAIHQALMKKLENVS